MRKFLQAQLSLRKLDDELLEVDQEESFFHPEKIKEGDSIVIFGKRENGTIRVIRKIKKIKDEFLPLERKFFHPYWKMK